MRLQHLMRILVVVAAAGRAGVFTLGSRRRPARQRRCRLAPCRASRASAARS
jgi:hypothetical protein